MTGPNPTTSAGFRFVSHRRRGLVAIPGVAAAGSVAVAAVLSDTTTSTPLTLGLAGLGAVQGIDTSLVTRQYPRPGATDTETEFFPLVEFAAPEMPWLVPAPDGPHGPLPWVCLVAVEQRAGVAILSSGPGLPDVLHIDTPAAVSQELPDPADAALWAHAYAATTVTTTTGDQGTSHDPAETTPNVPLGGCRLVAPRHLVPGTSYYAALVPVFAASALAGLGRSDQDVAAELGAPAPNFAWNTSDTSVQLPAYLHWEFSTGDGGDFESLARSLHEYAVPADFGTRPLDLGLAGPGMPETSGLATVFRGALTAPHIADQTPWPDQQDADSGQVDTTLSAEIHDAAALTAAAATTHQEGRPAVGPLLYANAAAARGDVTGADPAQDWFDQLNRDPRARATAGLATRVLRRNVEDVMARAWAQVGAVREANAILARLQMSRSVTASIHERHLGGLSAGRLLSATRPLLGRVALPIAVTGTSSPDALAAVASSDLPAGATWRGLTAALRPGTALAAAAGGTDGNGTGAGGTAGAPADVRGRLLASLVGGIAEPDVLPDGTVGAAAPTAVFGTAAAAALVSDNLRAAAAAANLTLPAAGADQGTLAAGLDAVTAGASQLRMQAATGLASTTSAVVNARPLPSTATFSSIGGVLVSQAALRSAALGSQVLVHAAAGGVSTVVNPAASAAAVTTPTASSGGVGTVHPAAALVKAALPGFGVPVTVPVTAPDSAPALAPALLPVAGVPPIQTIPVTPVPVGTRPVSTIPVGSPPISVVTPVLVQLTGNDARLGVMRAAYGAAVDRFIRVGMATPLPAGTGLDLDAARAGVMSALEPASTLKALAVGRVPALAVDRPDPIAPVMAGPVFTDAAYAALVAASHDAFVPGLDSVPPESVTVVQTNPTFIAAYLAGLNSALGHELFWRGFPTDERGTYWHSFWGAAPDIGPLHQFHGTLPDNVLLGTAPLLVLVLKGRLLKRYPDADIYAVVAGTDADVPELDDVTKFTWPIFRDFVDPDITLVGFPITYEQVVGTSGGNGYWFVIAEHPGQPRFGLTDPDAAVTHPPLPSWDELSWADLGPAAADTYLSSAEPPMSPAGTTRKWAASAADMAAITYQPAVRVAIRASDLLPAPAPASSPGATDAPNPNGPTP
jgi:hypothetical protein